MRVELHTREAAGLAVQLTRREADELELRRGDRVFVRAAQVTAFAS